MLYDTQLTATKSSCPNPQPHSSSEVVLVAGYTRIHSSSSACKNQIHKNLPFTLPSNFYENECYFTLQFVSLSCTIIFVAYVLWWSNKRALLRQVCRVKLPNSHLLHTQVKLEQTTSNHILNPTSVTKLSKSPQAEIPRIRTISSCRTRSQLCFNFKILCLVISSLPCKTGSSCNHKVGNRL